MKTLYTQMTLVMTMALFVGAGCAKESKKNTSGGNVYVDTGSGTGSAVVAPIGSGTGTGSTASASGITFSPVSLEEMNAYVATRPLNYPTDFRISINLKNNGENRFSGDVRLSYYDAGRRYEGIFRSENALNTAISGLKDNNVNDSTYNYWFMMGDKKVFSGFFEDEIGSVVLVIDNVVSQNDGQGGSMISGQVWYRNFAQSLAPKSPYRSCWFVYTGPYDCRSNHVIKKTALYPTDSYRKLGSFSGYMSSAAFQ